MAVAYDATGAGYSGSSGTFSFNHTPTAGAYAVVVIQTDRPAAPSNIMFGGVAMTLLASVGDDNLASTWGSLYLYGLANVAGGSAQAVTGTVGSSDYTVQSISYVGVSSVGTPVVGYSSSTAPTTLSTTCTSGQLIVGCVGFGCSGAGTSIITAESGGTQRALVPTSGGATLGLYVADSTTSPTTFSATLSTSGSSPWGTLTLILTGSDSDSFTASPATSDVAITGGTPTVSESGTGTANDVAAPSSATVAITGGTPAVTAAGSSGSSNVVAYDATGAGYAGSASTFAYSHTATAGAYVVLAIQTSGPAAPSNIMFGGVAMTLLASVGDDGLASTWGSTYLYGLANVSGGAQSVTGSISGGDYCVNTVSYTGVSTVGTPILGAGNSTTPTTGSIVCTTGQMSVGILGMGIAGAGSGGIGDPAGGTNRYEGSSSGTCALSVNDSASTTTFSATIVVSGQSPWGSIAVVLSPPPSEIASPASATVAITGDQANVQLSGIYPTTATVAITGDTPVVTATGSSGTGPFGPLLTKLAAGQSVVMQALGDSTCAGYNGVSDTGGWVADMAKLLGVYFDVTVTYYTWAIGFNFGPGNYTPHTIYTGTGTNTISMFNGGVDGTTLGEELEYIAAGGAAGASPVGGYLTTQCGYPAPDVLLVYDGYNDIGMTVGSQIASANWVADVERYLTAIQEYLPTVPVVWCTQHQTYGADQTVLYADQSAVAQMLTGNTLPLSPPVQEATASGYTPNIWVLDTQQAYNGYTAAQVMSTDLPHPSDAGYGILADWMLNVLAPAVEGAPPDMPTTATVTITGGTPVVTGPSESVSVSAASAEVAVSPGTPGVSVSAPPTPRTSPLGANWSTGQQFTAASENAVEAAVNVLAQTEMQRHAVIVTTSETLANAVYTDVVAIIQAGGAPTLPTAVNNSNTYTIFNETSTPYELPTSDGQTVNGAATYTILANGYVAVVSDGNNWVRIGSSAGEA